MSVCLACKGVTGEPHTCEASGLAVAEEAYAAGAVELGDELPNHTVTLSFVVRGTYEHADAVAFTLASELTARSDIAEPIVVAVKAHDGSLGGHLESCSVHDGRACDCDPTLKA